MKDCMRTRAQGAVEPVEETLQRSAASVSLDVWAWVSLNSPSTKFCATELCAAAAPCPAAFAEPLERGHTERTIKPCTRLQRKQGKIALDESRACLGLTSSGKREHLMGDVCVCATGKIKNCIR